MRTSEVKRELGGFEMSVQEEGGLELVLAFAVVHTTCLLD
jgi:hypothetical protein